VKVVMSMPAENDRPAPATTIASKPAAGSFDQAATLAIGGVTAWASLFEAAKLEPGQRLLVQGGARGVGSFAVQLGRWKGAQVIATASAGNLDLVRRLGADEVIDYTAVRFEDELHDLDAVRRPVRAGGGADAQALVRRLQAELVPSARQTLVGVVEAGPYLSAPISG